MEGKKNNFMGDIYTSYGPFVGKVCENTNTQLHQDNIIESITSSISPNSLNISNTSPIDKLNKGTLIGAHQDMEPVDVIPMIKQTHKSKGSKKIKFGGETKTNKLKIAEPNMNNKTVSVDEETGSFFNYKISIYNHKISIWILLLILLVLICIGYFIYKYWYLKNTSIITYKKYNSKEINKITNEENLSSENDDKTDNTDNTNDNNTSTNSSSNISQLK